MSKETSVSITYGPTNGNGNGSGKRVDALIREHVQSEGPLPGTLTDIAFGGEAASVVVQSAEGVTLYPGKEGDPSGDTGRWIDKQLEQFDGAQNSVLDDIKARQPA